MLCGVILFYHEWLVMAIAAVILGLAMPAILNYFLPDAISAKKTPDEKITPSSKTNLSNKD